MFQVQFTLLILANYSNFLQNYTDTYLNFMRICLFKDLLSAILHKHGINLQIILTCITQFLSQVTSITTNAFFFCLQLKSIVILKIKKYICNLINLKNNLGELDAMAVKVAGIKLIFYR